MEMKNFTNSNNFIEMNLEDLNSKVSGIPLNHLMAFYSMNQDPEEVRKAQIFQVQRKQIPGFWEQQTLDAHSTPVGRSQQQLPLARIRRIMKSRRDVKMISYETTIIISKACELLIKELTLCSWMEVVEKGRQTLCSCDFAKAIYTDETYDFLTNKIPFIEDDYPLEEYENTISGIGANSTTMAELNTSMDFDNEMAQIFQKIPNGEQQFLFDPAMDASGFPFGFSFQ